jgi:gliding motility-associated-like protein
MRLIISFLWIAFFMAISISVNAQSNLTQGLQLYLPFSGNANDASGKGHNAAVSGPVLTTDEYGNANSAYAFNGISDFMEIISTAALQCKDSISLCAKVYITDYNSNTCQSNVIIQKKNIDFGSGHYSLRFGDAPYDSDCNAFNPSSETFYGHMKDLGSFPIGSAPGQAGAPPYIALNQWYCAVFTWDGDTMRMYLNGVKTFQYGNKNLPNNSTTADNLFIGKSNDANYPFYFQGKLDEIRIYNRALRPSEINLYCTGCQTIQNTSPIITTADTSICIGKSVTLRTAANLPPSYTYQWQPAALFTNSTMANATDTPTANTLYYVQIRDTNGCTKIDSVQVSFYTQPVVNAGADTGICMGGNVSLSASGIGSFAWSPAIGLSNAAIANPICSVANATVYTVQLTDANGCTAKDSVAISMYASPIILIPAQYFYCLGAAPIQLTTGGAGSFAWSPAAGLSAVNINNPFASPAITTIYTVTLTNANQCTASSVVTIAVNPSPIITVGNGDTICNGQSTNLFVSGADTYFWKPSISLNNATIPNPIATPTVSTVYTVTGSNALNCGITATVNILVSPIINLQIVSTPDSTFCLGDSVQLIAYGGVSYTWAPLANTNIISNNSVKIFPPISTIYTVVATNDFGCSQSGTYAVVVQNPPIVSIAKSGDVTCVQKSVQLQAQGATDYIWQPNITLSAIQNDFALASPSVNTTYSVVGVLGKCSVDASVEVIFVQDENKKIYIPNAITINNDGVNDGFQIRSNIAFTSFQLLIYNRFGEKVFESNNIQKKWFGEHKGNYTKLLDSYFYYLRATDECGEIIRRGDITVIR